MGGWSEVILPVDRSLTGLFSRPYIVSRLYRVSRPYIVSRLYRALRPYIVSRLYRVSRLYIVSKTATLPALKPPGYSYYFLKRIFGIFRKYRVYFIY